MNGRLQIINYKWICNWHTVFVSNDYTVTIGLRQYNTNIMCKKHYKQEYYYTVFNWRVLQISSAPIILTTGKGTHILLKYYDNIKDASHIISRLIFIAGNKIQLLRPIINIILMSFLKKMSKVQSYVHFKKGLANLWHARPKCHAKVFLWSLHSLLSQHFSLPLPLPTYQSLCVM